MIRVNGCLAGDALDATAFPGVQAHDSARIPQRRAVRPARFVQPALRLLDHVPQFFLPPPVAMVHHDCVGTLGLLASQRLRALLARQLRLFKTAGRVCRYSSKGGVKSRTNTRRRHASPLKSLHIGRKSGKILRARVSSAAW